MKQVRAVHPRKPGGRLSAWQRALFASYSFIFALILPLICWGAYAAPGHPHRTPHFVFVEPVMVEHQPAASTIAILPGHEHHAALMSEPAEQATSTATVSEPESRAVGQASLSLLLFSILTFVALGLWQLAHIDERHQRRCFTTPFAKSILLPILLPPPRPISA